MLDHLCICCRENGYNGLRKDKLQQECASLSKAQARAYCANRGSQVKLDNTTSPGELSRRHELVYRIILEEGTKDQQNRRTQSHGFTALGEEVAAHPLGQGLSYIGERRMTQDQSEKM